MKNDQTMLDARTRRLTAAAPDLLAAAKHFIECAEHVDRTDFTGKDHAQTVRNFREIFAKLAAAAEG